VLEVIRFRRFGQNGRVCCFNDISKDGLHLFTPDSEGSRQGLVLGFSKRNFRVVYKHDSSSAHTGTATQPLPFIQGHLTLFLYSPMPRMTLIYMDVILTPTSPGSSLLPVAFLGAELLPTRAASPRFTLSWFY
jgi:hypothetical protein